MKERDGANGRSAQTRVAVTDGVPRGGLGCVASKGLAEARIRICGNDWTYGRNFGSVANEGVRGEEVRKTPGQGASAVQSGLARMVANYQTGCYHTRTVVGKINDYVDEWT